METKLKVTKSNALVSASYRFSLTEMQIILYGISLINPKQNKFPLIYQIDIKRFAETFDRKHGQIYQEIKEAIFKNLWERNFSYVDDEGKIVTNRWLTRITHDDKTGFIEIKFSEEIQPYLHQLEKNFTMYYIDKIAKFKSFYSIRFYEFSIMNLNRSKKNKCTFSLTIKEIRETFLLESKYERFYDMKKFIFDKAKDEINKYSDIKFSYKVIKLGRCPHKIEFTINKKETGQNQSCKQINKNLSPAIFEKAKKIIVEAGTRLDIYAIEQEFLEYTKRKGAPDNFEGAFLGFVKKKSEKTI